ncbi:hypothetical protein L1987_18452 [Smallanthus sonchifolius]|uniref:Uncharacterized protein n=1 Tax=Smallanthus sonchifolius TaxID=185202 RepID=A0ACB9J1Z6_9ASTR|nr:hypothetical protein L1987_18452 [Smallanthus sonchifolius]
MVEPDCDKCCADEENGVIDLKLRQSFDSFKLDKLLTLTFAVVGVAKKLLSLLIDHDLGCDTYGFGDIVLFGNKERMKITVDHKELFDVFLDNRINALGNCLSLWKTLTSDMIRFLENHLKEYQCFIVPMKTKTKSKKKENKQKPDENHEENHLTFEEMHPSISQFPNAEFYNGQILDGPNVIDKARDKHFLQEDMYRSYSFINVDYAKEELNMNYSTKHMLEVAVIAQIVANIFKGNKETMIKSGSVWNALVYDAENRGCVFYAHEDKNLAQVMVNFTNMFLERILGVGNLNVRKLVVSLLVKLSSGWRQVKKNKRNSYNDKRGMLNMFEIYNVNGDLCLLWSVDIVCENSLCVQGLKFWDILQLSQIQQRAKRLEGAFEP